MKFILLILLLANGNASVHITSPPYASTDFIISININSSMGLAGAQCDIVFNPSVVHAKSVENGGMFEIWAGDISGDFPSIDNENGIIRNIVAFNIGNVSYDGTLATINFEVVGEGNADIGVKKIILSDRNSNRVDAEITNSSTIVDMTPPSIGDVDILKKWRINISCNVSDNFHLKDVRINISHNGEWQNESMLGSKNFFFSLPSMHGNYSFYIYAVDGAGNANISSIKNFSIGNRIPHVSIKNPLNGSHVHGIVSVEGIAYDMDGNLTIERVEIKIDDGEWKYAGKNSWQYKWNTTHFQNGWHKIYARAYDGEKYSRICWINVYVENEKYAVRIFVNPANAGYVTIYPEKGEYTYGSSVEISAHPNNGYRFSHWSGDYAGTNSTIIMVVDGNKNITANFVPTGINFYYEPLFPYEGETIKFYGGDGDAWLWNFGDGNKSMERNPQHSYPKEGLYNVSLIITRGGEEYEVKKSIQVKRKINFSIFPSFPIPGSIVEMVASPENMKNYTWQFGDGNIAYGRNVSHIYAKGNYTITLSAIDENGRKVSMERRICVDYPDLYFEKVGYYRKGRKAIFNGIVRNGGGYVRGFKIAFYVNGREYVYEENISSRIFEFRKKFNLNEKRNDIMIVIDPYNKIFEKNEENNERHFTIYVPNYIPYFIIVIFLSAAMVTFLYFRRERIKIISGRREEKCNICLGKFKEGGKIIECECGALFHESCANRVGICPICGRKLGQGMENE